MGRSPRATTPSRLARLERPRWEAPLATQPTNGTPGIRQPYRNEFAMVFVTRVESANGVVMHIQDAASGNEVYLDAIELEALTRVRHADFAPLLDPSTMISGGEPDPDQV